MITDPLDKVDVDNLEILLETPAWKLIAERFSVDLNARRVQLESQSMPAEDLRYQQGFIAGLRHAWSIPRILIAEVKRSES